MTMLEKTLISFDGTSIVYRVGGQGKRWIVVANGYGGSFWAWTDIFSYLEKKYRLLLWDYRGFYRSGIPSDPCNLQIEDNCRDLDRLMEAEGIDEMALAGWSVGVQVALEQYRRRPETINALMLINGSHGRVLHRSMDGRGLFLPLAIRGMKSAAPMLTAVLLPTLRLMTKTPKAIQLFAALGLIQTTNPCIHEAWESVLGLDWGLYLRMMLLADKHDTEDLLPRVSVPTLVIAGDRDMITRPSVCRHIAETIPQAEYFEVPNGTHYIVMEYPRLMANRMDNFLISHLDYPPTAR